MSDTDRELLHKLARSIMENDPELANQAKSMRYRHEEQPYVKEMQAEMRPALEGFGGGVDEELALETIVVRQGRPVLRVSNDAYVLEGPESETWMTRLGNDSVRRTMTEVIKAVGRIEVDNHPNFTWVGTGWLVDDDVIVTNRHVAELFATKGTDGLTFRKGWPDPNVRVKARVDFKEEEVGSKPHEFSILDILYIEEDFGPDLAFLKVNKTSAAGSSLSTKLRLARDAGEENAYVATIGYPAADSRVPDQDLVKKLFGDVYNVKRMGPGQLKKSRDGLILHDCSTLGGNSGSPLVSIANGEVYGLHFSGLFMRENRAVPAAIVRDRLSKLRGKPHSISRNIMRDSQPPAGDPKCENSSLSKQNPDAQPTSPLSSSTPGNVFNYKIDVTIPIEVSVNVGSPQISTLGTSNVGIIAPFIATGKTASLDEAVKQAKAQLESNPEVLKVYRGFVFEDGWITDKPAICVVVKDVDQLKAEAIGFSPTVAGFPVEVRAASPEDYAESMGLFETLEGFPNTTYTPPEDTELEEVDEEMEVICHVSPDAGWPTLKDFLSRTRKRLTIGIYDYTAPHVVSGVLSAVEAEKRKLLMVVQAKASLGGGTKKDDIPEEETVKNYKRKLDNRFKYVWASVGKNHRFASSYHIKVIVRDGQEIWLSSGNLQSSNMPDSDILRRSDGWNMLMKHNREWNIVLRNRDIASQYEDFLKHDFKQAKEDSVTEASKFAGLEFFVEAEVALEERPAGDPTYFEPLRIDRKVKVQPLLTPDNYAEHVLKLIKSAKREILFQNQSFSILADGKNDDRFTQLFEALLKKQQSGVDVRIIIRGDFSPEQYVEKLKLNGFDTSKIKLQNRCHTKAIVVDDETVLVGSHNWTNQGTCVNRDASLIFHDKETAKYFSEVFWFDWKKMARKSVKGARRVRLTNNREAPLPGMVRMSWQELMG